MKFKVNNDIWEVKFLGADELLALYREKADEKASYVFGVTIRSEHVIYINGEMNNYNGYKFEEVRYNPIKSQSKGSHK